MTKILSVARVAVALCIVPLFLLSCSIGLEPAWKNESPVVRMVFGGGEQDVDRAVARGSGYLYMKTLGGPEGAKNTLLGPYSVTWGKSFTTTDLEHGTYSSILIFHSSEKFDLDKSFTYVDKKLTLKEVLSNNAIMSFIADNSKNEIDSDYSETENETPSGENLALEALMRQVGNYFAGKVAFGVSDSITLNQGRVTDLSMTLVPILSDTSRLEFSGGTQASLSRMSTSLVKEFFGLEVRDNSDGGNPFTVTITVAPSAENTLKLGNVALYTKAGKLIKTKGQESLVDVKAPLTFTISSDEALASYVYVEYQGALRVAQKFSFSSGTDVIDETLPVQIRGLNDGANKRFIYMVFAEMPDIEDGELEFENGNGNGMGTGEETGMGGETGMGLETGMEPDFDQMYFGFLDLNGKGSGSGALYKYKLDPTNLENPIGVVPASLMPKTDYYCMGYVDMDGRTNSFENAADFFKDMSQFDPHKGDLVTFFESEGIVTLQSSPSSVITFTANMFAPFIDDTLDTDLHVYGLVEGVGKRVFALVTEDDSIYGGGLFGIATIDSTGSALMSLIDIDTLKPAVIDPGKHYLVSAMVDMGGRYPNISYETATSALLDSIKPSLGDYATNSFDGSGIEIIANNSGVIGLVASDFIQLDSISFNGDPALSGMRFIYALDVTPWDDDPHAHYVGFIDFDANGNGAGPVYKKTAGVWERIALLPQTPYYFGGFINKNNSFGEYNTIAELFNTGVKLEPVSGDLVLQNDSMMIETNEQGRLWIESSMFDPFAEAIAVAFTITSTEPGDPELTAPSFSMPLVGGSITVTAPSGFISYRWLVDGIELIDQIGNILTLNAGSPQIMTPRPYHLTLEVENKSGWYSSVVTFTVY